MAQIEIRMVANVGLITLAAMLAGCTTHLDAVRVRSGAPIPAAGAPYNLSFTQYDVTITRRVAACQARNADGVTEGALVIAMDAQIKRKEARDPSRHYVIDMDSLQAGWKITNVEVEYHENGTLKSINAAAEDRTAQILVSTVASLGKLVTAFAGVAGVEATGCTDNTQATLNAVEEGKARIKAKAAQLAGLTRDLEGMTAIATAMGEAWGENERKQFAEQLKAVHAAKTELTTEQEGLTDLLAKISNVTKFTWPLNGTTFVSPTDTSLVPDLSVKLIREWGAPEDPSKAQANSRVYARIESTSPIGTTATCEDGCDEDAIPGLKYRMPAAGKLLICSAPTCDPDKEQVVAVEEGMISQLGPVFTLPLRSAIFSKKTLIATFNDAGQPTKIGVKGETAAGEAAATSFGQLTDTFIAARGKLVPSELDRIKAETEMLKAQADLAAAKKALQPPAHEDATTATAAFAADNALLQAQLVNLQARAALDAALKAMEN